LKSYTGSIRGMSFSITTHVVHSVYFKPLHCWVMRGWGYCWRVSTGTRVNVART